MLTFQTPKDVQPPTPARDQSAQTQAPPVQSSESPAMPTTPDNTLPKTASPIPLIGLIGLLSLGSAFYWKRFAKRTRKCGSSLAPGACAREWLRRLWRESYLRNGHMRNAKRLERAKLLWRLAASHEKTSPWPNRTAGE